MRVEGSILGKSFRGEDAYSGAMLLSAITRIVEENKALKEEGTGIPQHSYLTAASCK